MSINELKHPEIAETNMSFLNERESMKLAGLRTNLGPEYANFTDFTLYRFLKVNSFHRKGAEKQFRAYMQWRKDKHLDHVLDTLPNKIDTIRTLVPHSYHGYDVDGRPIYIEKTGKISPSALADESILPHDDFMNSHIWGIEHLMALAHAASLQRRQRIETFTSIIDMEGLGFAHRSALHLLNQCMTLDQTYYPDFIGQLFILNTPWVAPMMYNAAAPFVPAEIRSRVHVLKTVQELTQYVAPDQMPVEFGGACTLHGGVKCVEEKDPSEIVKLVQNAHDDGLEKHYVHHHYDKTLHCDEKGGTFTWYFETDEGYDLDFSVEVKDADGKRFIKTPTRCQTNRGSYTGTKKTDLKLKWDNSYSWMHGKNLKYSASVVQMDENVKNGQHIF